MIKDPVISILLPAYANIFHDLNIDLNILIVKRDTSEVVNSICKRDGLSKITGYTLALFYSFHIEKFKRNKNHFEVTYRALLLNPVDTLQQICDWLNLGKTIADGESKAVTTFVDGALNNNTSFSFLSRTINVFFILISYFVLLRYYATSLIRRIDLKN